MLLKMRGWSRDPVPAWLFGAYHLIAFPEAAQSSETLQSTSGDNGDIRDRTHRGVATW
jgi:hypothetical protein